MGSVEWNKKEELVAEQALKHLKVYRDETVIGRCCGVFAVACRTICRCSCRSVGGAHPS